MSFCILQIAYSHIIGICKLFSCNSKPTHALLASYRRPLSLQKVPFKTLTNALLKFN